ncbi:MAG: FmdB family zinc ribbon protein [Candidatus Nanopelagicales bacterium]
MPTYLYKCTECGHRFEHAQGFHDDPLEICPDCGGVVRRVIGNVGVAFKGSGFYRTDSRAESASKAKKSAASGEKKSDGSPKREKTAAKESSGGSDSKGSGSSSSGSGSSSDSSKK